MVGVGICRTGVPKADGGLFLISRRASRADAVRVSWAETEATVAGAGATAAAAARMGGGLFMCYFYLGTFNLLQGGTVCVLVDSMDSSSWGEGGQNDYCPCCLCDPREMEQSDAPSSNSRGCSAMLSIRCRRRSPPHFFHFGTKNSNADGGSDVRKMPI